MNRTKGALNTRLSIQYFLFLPLLAVLLTVLLSAINVSHAGNRLVYSVNFSDQPEGDARPWFLDKGYLMKLDADEIELFFKNKQLNLKTSEAKAGLFGLKLKPEHYLADVTSVEIEWA